MMEVEMDIVRAPSGSNSPPTECPQDEREERKDSWTSRNHLMALIGFATGIETIVRFPILCSDYGAGAFIVAYLVMLLVVGFPLLLLESFIGQFTSSNCITVYSHYPAFKGVGIMICITIAIILPHACTVMGHPLIYLVHSFSGSSPWTSCKNAWNTANCLPLYWNSSDYDPLLAFNYTSPGQEFYRRRVLVEQGGTEFPLDKCLASFIVCLLLFFSVFKGVKFLAKVMWALTCTSLVLLVVLFVHAITLPGAIDGIKYHLRLDFYSLQTAMIWIEAMIMAFSTYGFGYGVYTTLGSFAPFRNRFAVHSLVVCTVSTVFTFVFTLFVFSVLGFKAHEEGKAVYQFRVGPFDLLYSALAEATSMMSKSTFWSITLYTFLFLVDVDALIIFMQVLVVCIEKSFSKCANKRWQVTLVSCGLTFILSLPYCAPGAINFSHGVLAHILGNSVFVICFVQTIIFAYIYGVGQITRDLDMLSNVLVSCYCYFTWIFFTPALLLLLLIQRVIMMAHTLEFGLITSMSSMFFIAIYSFYYILRKQCCQKYKNQRPKPWRPKAEADKTEWREFCARHPLRNSYAHHTF